MSGPVIPSEGRASEADRKPPLEIALKYWQIILLLLAGIGAVVTFTGKFAALSKEVELLREEVKACREGHPALQEDVHAAMRSVEQLRCEVQGLAFDFGSLKCSSSPAPTPQAPPSSGQIFPP